MQVNERDSVQAVFSVVQMSQQTGGREDCPSVVMVAGADFQPAKVKILAEESPRLDYLLFFVVDIQKEATFVGAHPLAARHVERAFGNVNW